MHTAQHIPLLLLSDCYQKTLSQEETPRPRSPQTVLYPGSKALAKLGYFKSLYSNEPFSIVSTPPAPYSL